MATLSDILGEIICLPVEENEQAPITLLRIEEEEKAFIFSKKTAERVTVHVVDDRYVRCPGKDCPHCESGKRRFLPITLLLFPAYSLTECEVGVVRCSEKNYPGSLLNRLLPVLKTEQMVVAWIYRQGQKFHLRTEKPLDGDVDDALLCLENFERDIESGVVDLKNAVPSISLAELQTAVAGVSKWVR